MCGCRVVRIEKDTVSCDGVERPRTVECYRRNGAGDFDRDRAVHGSNASPLAFRASILWTVFAHDRLVSGS